jgi:hypothetical protein
MNLEALKRMPWWPPLCGCGAGAHEAVVQGRDGPVVRRHCLSCGAGESMTERVLDMVAANSKQAKAMRAAHAR